MSEWSAYHFEWWRHPSLVHAISSLIHSCHGFVRRYLSQWRSRMSERCGHPCFATRPPSEELRRLGAIPQRFQELRGRVRSVGHRPPCEFPVTSLRPTHRLMGQAPWAGGVDSGARVRGALPVAALCALLSVLDSCASTTCRPLREPRPVQLPFEGDDRTDVCEVANDTTDACRDAEAHRRGYVRWHSPRCAADDPDCGPQLVRGTEACFPTQAARRPYGHVRKDNPHQCTYDGECSYRCDVCMRFAVGAFPCPPRAVPSLIGPLHPPDPLADPWGGTFPTPTWCGCVEGQCQFFNE